MIKDILEKLALKNDLTKEEMQSAVESIMTGKVDDNDIETFLIALNEKGVKEPEITAAAMVMKDKSLKFDIGDGTHIDTAALVVLGYILLIAQPPPPLLRLLAGLQ